MNQDAIFAGSLSKTWKRIKALDGITLRVPSGAAFAVLGPNGAGKTTFVKILLGAVRATSGVATVFGHPAGSVAARASIGYVPESASAPLHLTPAQLIDFQSALYGIEGARRRPRTAELLKQVEMTKWADTPLAKCSRGMRQRVAIAAALAHSPQLLILDEPTDGLDPASRREVIHLLQHLNRAEGVTLLVNSHLLHEVEELCSEVAILSHGHLVHTSSLTDLAAQAGYTVVLGDARPELESVFATRGTAAVRSPEGLLRLHLTTREQLDWTLECARTFGARIETLSRPTNRLETVYLAETQRLEEVTK